jgi:hypothetical protein
MSEPTALTGDLDRDLRSYFALTTTTPLPRRVTEMSARTLGRRRSPVAALLTGGVGVLATAALVVILATRSGPHSSTVSNGAAANGGSAFESPSKATAITYPGVDTASLARSGVQLLLPAGHGSALVSPAQAQADARAGLGSTAGPPGPAVLAFAQLFDRPQPATCLCWVVDVAVTGGVAKSSPGAPVNGTELVLVDALNGRVVAALSGNGIP